MDVQLKRFASHSEVGTFGEFTIEGRTLYTVERPWECNKPFVSCIPPGKYVCKRVQSPKFGDTFEVMDVPGRTHILFHVANVKDDLHGCIGLGLYLGVAYNKWAVTSSRLAIQKFAGLTTGVDEFNMEIT